MKILVYGDFNFGGGPFDGATTKTRNIYESLRNRFEDVAFFNIEGWRKSPFKKYFQLKRAIKNVDVIVFIPGAKNGTYFALDIFFKAKKRRNIKLYYFVAGSLLTQYLQEKPRFIRNVNSLDGVFCETQGLISELKQLGVGNNLYLSPTFDLRGDWPYIPREECKTNVYHFCSFSRVNKQKGISIAIEAINRANFLNGDFKILYDIYGKLDLSYKEEMELLISKSGGMVRYQGIISDDSVIKTLSQYDATIFASYFDGECLPATVLESLKASTPLLISDWKYNREIIDDGVEGFVFGNSADDLFNTIVAKCKNENPFTKMRINCFNKSKKYTSEKCLQELYFLLEK